MHLIVKCGCFRYEIRLFGHVHRVKLGQRIRAITVALELLVHRPQQVLGMNNADNVLGLVLVNRQACMRRGKALLKDYAGIVIGVQHFDLRTVKHDLFNGSVTQIKRAKDTVAMFFLNDAFRMAKLDGTGDFLLQGKNMGVRIGLDPEYRKDLSNQSTYRCNDRREDENHDTDERRNSRCRGFRVGNRIGLGKNLGEDQNKESHQKRGQRNTAFAEQAGE